MIEETQLTADLQACTLCPRACGVDRTKEQVGYCRAGLTPRIFRHGPHFGEEPPISGTCGSGTIFFSHCTLRCIYCQNHPWSQGGQGEDMDIDALAQIFRSLAEQGCHNWNLVSPTPWLPQVKKAVQSTIKDGFLLPFVYNTSGFESVRTLQAYADLIDIALVDLRYAQAASAAEGSDAPGYVDAARQSVLWLWDKLGALQLDGDGIATRGVVCRLLALPGRTAEVVDNLRWLAENVGTQVAVSVMSQYVPLFAAESKPGWDRAVQSDEYETIVDAVSELGFENGWVQELEATTKQDLLGQNMSAGEGAVGR